MTDQSQPTKPRKIAAQAPSDVEGESNDTFTWHPDYAGQTVASVERGLAADIARDQRQYQLALDGAEQSEHESLTSIVELERRWGNYAFDWAEMDANELARRIVTYHRECDRRQEIVPFSEYRASGALLGGSTSDDGDGSGFSPLILAIAAVVIILVIVILVF